MRDVFCVQLNEKLDDYGSSNLLRNLCLTLFKVVFLLIFWESLQITRKETWYGSSMFMQWITVCCVALALALSLLLSVCNLIMARICWLLSGLRSSRTVNRKRRQFRSTSGACKNTVATASQRRRRRRRQPRMKSLDCERTPREGITRELDTVSFILAAGSYKKQAFILCAV